MPSAWNRIGANWEDLRNTRLEPVINELYKATIERDYWIRLTGREFDPTPLSAVKYNTSYQIRKIYELFEIWFRPVSTGGTIRQLETNESVFIYDDGKEADPPITIGNADMVFSSIYGKGSVDYTSDGILSNLVGLDMSFLANGAPLGRVNIDHLEALFKVLNMNLKNRLFNCIYKNNTFTSVGSRSDLFLQELRNSMSGSDNAGTAVEVINKFNSNIIPDEVLRGLFRTSYTFGAGYNGVDTFSAGFQQRFFMFKDFDVTDFNIDSYVFGDATGGGGDFDISYSPNTPYNEIIRDNFISVLFEGQRVNAFLPYIPTVISSMSGTERGSIGVTFNSQNFIDINNSALIDYYTEEAN